MHTLNRIADIYKKRFGENAVEAVLGLMSTLVTDKQLEVLLEKLEEEENERQVL